jgi:hypothetical protein
VPCRVRDGDGRPLGDAEQREALQAHRIDDRFQIADPHVDRRIADFRVREPAASLVVSDDRVTHPVHVVTTLQLEAMAEYDRPVGIGALVPLDTTVPVHVPAVAAAVRARCDRWGAISARRFTVPARGASLDG